MRGTGTRTSRVGGTSVAVLVLGLAFACGTAGAASAAGGAGSAAASDETWYLTFHGQGGDTMADDAAPDAGSSGVNQIQAYGSSGGLVQSAVLSADPSEPLSELRGMAIGSDGSLYVANATQTDSAVLHFGGAATQSSSRAAVAPDGVFAHGAPVNTGLDHPYGLAFLPSGELLASSQDSQVVTRFTPGGGPDPSASAASWWTQNYPDADFAPGTLAPSTTLVHAKDGGLSAPRGIAVVPGAGGGDPTLYVADNGADAVRSYDAVTGEFLGDVLTSKAGGIGSPVGLAVFDGRLYVTSEGTDDVVSLDLASGTTHRVVPKKLDHVTLDHPSGIAFGTDGRLYVASRVGQQIAAYTLDSKEDRAVSAEVFIDELPDQPEQLLAVTLPVGGLDEEPVPPPSPAPDPGPGGLGGPPSGSEPVSETLPGSGLTASAQLAATGADTRSGAAPAAIAAALALLAGALVIGRRTTLRRRGRP